MVIKFVDEKPSLAKAAMTGTRLKDDRLKKAQAALTDGQKAHARQVVALGEAVSKPLLGDCSNPDCPYRQEVLKTRAKTKARVDRFRKRAKA